MALIKKEAIPKVAITEMNDDHFEEIEIINQLHDIVFSGSDHHLISEKLVEL